MEDIAELEEKLVELQHEHKDLDDIIDRLRNTPPVDFLQMKRLQKKKLQLKDMIQKIKSELIPDIIAWVLQNHQNSFFRLPVIPAKAGI